MKILITGGAQFIGSALVRYIIGEGHEVVNIDKLTYAGDLQTLTDVADSTNYNFVKADICDASAMCQAFSRYQPGAVLHLAAESHVDRSIDGSAIFIKNQCGGNQCAA